MSTGDYLIKVFTQFFSYLFKVVADIFINLVNMFNFKEYWTLTKEYSSTNGGWVWIIVILVFLLLIAITAGIVFLIVWTVKKYLRLHKSLKKQDAIIKEVGKLNKELAYAHNALDKRIKSDLARKKKESGEASTEEEEEDDDIRFKKLTLVDKKYANGNPETLNTEFTLEEVCINFRNFAGSKLKLYYDLGLVKEFVASLAAVRLIILQGISGTGKTSLPYAFGKFLGKDSFIQAIQPSWKERSEMLGFFNEFTKKYKEPEFLRNLYEASYSNNVHITVLDEMNIARVEYYFAEFLSVLEMPRREEWIVELISSMEAKDPVRLFGGKMTLPPNMWYVGTANNDDSTFAVSDKVYDRAMIIDIDKKFEKFTPIDTEAMPLDYRKLDELFEQAKKIYPLSSANIAKLDQLDSYVIEHFRVAFGNRIMRQMYNFVPAYIACGGTEVDGIDFVLVKKVFRKFSALNLSYLKDEVDNLIAKLDSLWGSKNFRQSKEFLTRICKMG